MSVFVHVHTRVLPWWLAGLLSQERVVDSAPLEHPLPAGSERGLGGRGQG